MPRIIFGLSAGGVDISSKIAGIAIDMTVTDGAGRDSDTVSLTLDDNGGRIGGIAPGTQISVYGGTDEKGVRNFGIFTVDDVQYEGYPQRVTINAQASDVTSKEKERDTKGFAKDDGYATYQSIFSEVAGQAGLSLKMDGSLGGKPNPSEFRDREDPIAFLTRLGYKINATVTVKEKQLVVVPRGSGRSASGQGMGSLLVSPGVNLLSYSVSIKEKPKHSMVETKWFDRRKVKYEVEQAPLTKGQGKVPFRIRPPFQDQDEAREAAEGEAGELSRNQGTASFELDGEPFATAESFAVVSGVRAGVDGQWFIKTATHNFSSTGPYTTSIECEVPVS